MRKLLRAIPFFSDAIRLLRDVVFAFRPPKLNADGFLYIGNTQVVSGNYEPEVKQLLHKVKGNFHKLVNIGANNGYYLCLAANIGFHDITGVEPLKQNLRVLRRNLSLNSFDFVKVIAGACGKSTDQFIVLHGSGTGASTQKGWGGASSNIRRRVPSFSLDSLVQVTSDPCIFIIDVEGYENKVLDGATNLFLRSSDIWIVEISFYENSPGGEMNPDALEIFKRFKAAGFTAFGWNPDLREIKIDRFKDLEEFAYIFHMFLFVKKSLTNHQVIELLTTEST
jgi:FkbM family methyltransferase